MFEVSPSIFVYNASDQSGVLVFVQKLGKVVSLAMEVGTILLDLKEGQKFDLEIFKTKLSGLDSEQVEEVWHTLKSEGILIEER